MSGRTEGGNVERKQSQSASFARPYLSLLLPATATARLIASAMVAVMERKPSKFASTISSITSAGEAIGEKTESVIDTIFAPCALAALVSVTVSEA